MTKIGSCGGWATIHTPILYKKVSCATCTFYDRDDHGCVITAIVPYADRFYYKQGESLSTIELVEYRKDGSMIVASGPVEKNGLQLVWIS